MPTIINGSSPSITFSDNTTQSSGITATNGVISVASGGTGLTTLTANNVLLGNGTSALQVVAPSTAGNVLTSNGTTWTSAAGGLSGSTTQLAKAWVNYNVSGGSSSVRGSFNVSSVTYNSTGVSTVNFTNAMANTNYATVMNERPTSDTANPIAYIAPTALSGVYTTSAVTVRTAWSSSPQNPDIVCVIIFGT
jgi:hypothetical protein